MRCLILMILLTALLPAPGMTQDALVIEQAEKIITLSGFTRAIKNMTLSSEVSGKIIQIHYRIGEEVGEKPYLEIDPTFIDLQIESTARQLDRLEANLKQAESRVAFLTKDFSRIEALYGSKSITEREFDTISEELNQARLALEAIAQEKMSLEISLKDLKERKLRYTVSAPNQWTVVEKIAEAGEIVGLQSPLARLADFRTMVVPLAVSAEELSLIRALPETFDALVDETPVRASLSYANPEFDERTRKHGIEILITDYEGNHRGGLRFSLDLSLPAAGLAVPKAAVVSTYENPRVTLAESGETVAILILGETNGSYLIAYNALLSKGMVLKRAEK